MAMNTLMTMPRTKDLKCWFFIDELGALHRLPRSRERPADGAQFRRRVAIVTGIHAYAKLKEVYGENMAMTLASLARTKLILGTADWRDCYLVFRLHRPSPGSRHEEAATPEAATMPRRRAVSPTPRKHIEPLLLP